jgi:hypothetical protein
LFFARGGYQTKAGAYGRCRRTACTTKILYAYKTGCPGLFSGQPIFFAFMKHFGGLIDITDEGPFKEKKV